MRTRSIGPDHYEHKVAIVGLGRSRSGTQPEPTWTSLAREACGRALQDAGLPREEVDGVSVHGGSLGLPGLSTGGVRGLSKSLDLRPIWHDGATESPGGLGALIPALLAVSASLCRHVLVLDVGSGSTAALMISAAEGLGARHRPVWIDAVGSGHSDALGDISSRTSLRTSAEHLWHRASVTPEEVDLALIDARRTFDVLGQLETLGLRSARRAPDPAGGAARIGPEGDLPVNPDGSGAAAGNPGYGRLREAVLQLRGEAGPHQIPGSRVVLVSSLAEGSSTAMLLTSQPLWAQDRPRTKYERRER